MKYRIGIDSGGTFTDIMVAGEDGRIYSLKIPSTPRDPSLSFLEGIRRALGELGAGPDKIEAVLHGTTVATNALLESNFPAIGLVVTRGFREILEIARQTVPGEWGSIYVWVKPPRVVPLERVQEVTERVGPRGEVQIPLNEEEMRAVARWFKEKGIEAVAISFLHSYINPAHELRAREILEEEHPDCHLSTSWETLPELREYERTLTTCLNAALKPVLSRYLSGLSSKMARLGIQAPLQVMKSAGGVMDAERAIVQPVYTVLSGPSAAVLGMAAMCRQAGYPGLITLDMGGTSTDVSLIERGMPLVSTSGEIDIYPIKAPTVEIASIGAGGGSIAWLGAGERIRVGPRSAGADPGPACYDKGGGEPTVTDANLALGRIPPYLLGGEMGLRRERAEEALQGLGRRIGLGLAETAHGIIEIANFNMTGAIRQVSVRKGKNPVDYALVALGGAGPLHAGRLAELLGIQTVIVPPYPGLGAAFGLLVADVRDDFVLTDVQREDRIDLGRLNQRYRELEAKARESLERQRVPKENCSILRTADLRYVGMATELNVPVTLKELTKEQLRDIFSRFHLAHQEAYGYSYQGKQLVEWVNLRCAGIGLLPKLHLPEVPVRGSGGSPPVQARRPVIFEGDGRPIDCPIYERSGLLAGDHIEGPAIVEEYNATTVILPGQVAEVDRWGNLVIQCKMQNAD